MPEGSDPVAGYEREAALLRSLAAEPIEPVDAPPEVWAGIAAAVAEPPGPVAVTEPTASSRADDRPVVLADRRRPVRWIAAAAAAVVVLVVGGVIVATRGGGDGSSEVASAQLQPVDGVDVGGAKAEVRLQRKGDAEQLDVEMRNLPPPAPGTFYELWLLSKDGDPVPLAQMRDPAPAVSTAVDVPAGTDTERYDVVDVSVQHDGAGPAHSGESILRGTLS